MGAERGARALGIACAALGALGFSFKAILVKAAYRYNVDAPTLLCLRMAYALPGFALLAWQAQRREPRVLTRRDGLDLLILGFLGYYLASVLDFEGLRWVSAPLERIVLYTYPSIVVILTALRGGIRVTPRLVGLLVLTYVGVALAVAPELPHGSGQTLTGVLLVFGSSLSFALYLMRCGPAIARLGATRVTALATGIACVLCIVQFGLLDPWRSLVQPWPVHAYGLAMGVFATVLPVWLINAGIRRLGAPRAALVGTLGPVFTILLAAAFLGEPLRGAQVLGAAVVIAAVGALARGG